MSPSISALRTSNAARVSALKGTPVAVFVGGTSGIGQALAETFASWRNGNAHIVLVGRNEKVAQSIIDGFPKPAAPSTTAFTSTSTTAATPTLSWSHSFVQCDATLMSNVHNTSQTILRTHPKINYLILSPGFFSTAGRIETSEGIDKKLAVHYYARFKFVQELLPALKAASEAGEDAKVLSVLGAGMGSSIDLEDLGLVKDFSARKAAGVAPTYTDLAFETFAKQNPDITFAHSNPGLVNTGIIDASQSRWVHAISPAFKLLYKVAANTPEVAANYQWAGLLEQTGGAVRIGEKGENLGTKKYFGDDEQRRKVWEHSLEMTRT